MSRPGTKPNAENCTLSELDTAIKAGTTDRSRIRMHAIKALIIGIPHHQVCELFCVEQRSLFNWVDSFNSQGIDGLIERPRAGRPHAISVAAWQELTALLEKPAEVGQTHWTARKFHGYLTETLGHQLGYSTLVRGMHEQGFSLQIPRPWPDRQNEEARVSHRALMAELQADPDVEVWYADEMGVEGDPRPRRTWLKVGAGGRVPRNGWHLRMNVSGMVCPRTGEFFALEFTHSDRAVFQAFLDEANATVSRERRRNILIVDNASWHKSRALNWGAFEPLYLPAYSPDLNPIERLWQVLKAQWFNGYIAHSTEQLTERLDKALLWAMNRTDDNTRTCAIRK